MLGEQSQHKTHIFLYPPPSMPFFLFRVPLINWSCLQVTYIIRMYFFILVNNAAKIFTKKKFSFMQVQTRVLDVNRQKYIKIEKRN